MIAVVAPVVLAERPAEGVGLVRINRPDARNALNLEVRKLLAIEQVKECVLCGMDASLDTGLALETKAIQMLFASQDQKEGMAAFIEKRKAKFQGR